MGKGLIILLIIGCVATAAFVLRKINKAQFKIGDTLFWLGFSLFLLIMSIFPGVIYKISDVIGFEAPSNFVFIVIIFLLLVKIFLLDVRVSRNEDKLIKLAQKYALDNEKNKTE